MKKGTKNIGIFIVLALITIVTLSANVFGNIDEEHNHTVNIDFTIYEQFNASEINETILRIFHSNTCPHCKEELEYLETIKDKYPGLMIVEYEINEENNLEFLTLLSDSCGKQITGVPATFIGNEVIVGFGKNTPEKIESAILYCNLNECIDPTLKTECNHNYNSIVNLPFFGEIDTSKISMPLFTFIIGLLDGFNPCAMWVLTVLLTLITYAKSRKKILLIGGIFALVSGLMYFLIMFVWLTFFLQINSESNISFYARLIIATVAIVVGLINIKEFFWFKKGVSLTISDQNKSKLLKKMRKLVKENNTWVLIISTITLALFANLIELACTAGLPAIFTNILSMQERTGSFGYYSYLILYNVAYIIPLAIIVTLFAFTLGKYKFTEKQGKVLKIIGGILMLILGLLLLFKPEILSF